MAPQFYMKLELNTDGRTEPFKKTDLPIS